MSVLHAAAIRVRIVGNGNVIPTFYGFDKIDSQELVAIEMANPSARKKTRLGNFVSQGIMLKLETRKIDEFMKVNDITIFVSEIWTDYPQ